MPEWNRVTAALVLLLAVLSQAAEYAAPAGVRPAVRRPGAASILPGGRLINPIGIQYVTGPGPYALAASPTAKTIISANRGPERFSVTILERDKTGHRLVRHIVSNGDHDEWRGVATGAAFDGEHTLYVSEGASGRIWSVNPADGERRRAIDLNQDGATGSITADLAFDPQRKLLHVIDPANSRFAAIDAGKRKIAGALRFDGAPTIMALSPDRRRAYVLLQGKSNSVVAVNLDNPAAPALGATLLTGGNPSGLLATADRVFISDIGEDSITVIDAKTNQKTGEVLLRVPGLQDFRGLEPTGLAYHEQTGWLLVAESGANAIGVIDTKEMKLIGHLPVGWAPARILIDADQVYVTNARGHGIGPNTGARNYDENFADTLGRGTISSFPLPAAGDLPSMTEQVMVANGYTPKPSASAAPIPDEVRHVVLIMKGNRTFDDVLGDIREAGNGPVLGAPALARHGQNGYADGQNVRLSLQGAAITPNHHKLAESFSFSENFYVDSGSSIGTRWGHIERLGISVFTMPPLPPEKTDQARADAFIDEIQRRYGEGKAPLPQLIVLRLPNDRLADPRPGEGFLYGASYISDNDLALGRIVEFLSQTPWWKQMAVFVTESALGGGFDHIDAHRSILLCAGPYFKKNYVSHVNTSFPGLLKTIFRILRLPPLNLFDATASDLGDTFTDMPDFTPYVAAPVDKRVFDPVKIVESSR